MRKIIVFLFFLASLASTLIVPASAVNPFSSTATVFSDVDAQKSGPCDQAKPYVEKVTNFSKTKAFDAALDSLKNKAVAAPGLEFSIAFGEDTMGNVTSSAINAGGRSSGNIPAMPNPFGDLHNHPNNTPPSSGDLYGLIRRNSKNKNYDTRFVITQDGRIYAMVINDTAAASAFLSKYPPQQEAGYSPLFPDALFDEYRKIQYGYGVSEEIAMAYVLEKYEAGVSLLKRYAEGDFKKLRTVTSGAANNLVFAASNCE